MAAASWFSAHYGLAVSWLVCQKHFQRLGPAVIWILSASVKRARWEYQKRKCGGYRKLFSVLTSIRKIAGPCKVCGLSKMCWPRIEVWELLIRRSGFLSCIDQRDIGCLIMADHLLERNCELVYMGIVPEARGLARGVEIVRFAQWHAGQSKIAEGNAEQNVKLAADRLVLAVDVANSPAIRMYAAAGFQTWDRRSVFLREIAEKN